MLWIQKMYVSRSRQKNHPSGGDHNAAHQKSVHGRYRNAHTKMLRRTMNELRPWQNQQYNVDELKNVENRFVYIFGKVPFRECRETL